MRIAEQYIEAFGELAAKKSTTTLLPSNVANPAGMMTQALVIHKSMIKRNSSK